MLKMKNTICGIYLNPNGHCNGVYHTGQTLSGNVVLTFYEKQKVKGLSFANILFCTAKQKLIHFDYRYCYSNSWNWQMWMDWATSIIPCRRDLLKIWNKSIGIEWGFVITHWQYKKYILKETSDVLYVFQVHLKFQLEYTHIHLKLICQAYYRHPAKVNMVSFDIWRAWTSFAHIYLYKLKQ